LKSALVEGEHPTEFLTQWEMDLKMLEDWLDNPKLEGGYQEISMPGETCQHELQLEEDGIEPTEELTVVSISKEIAEKKLSDEIAESEFAAKWPVNVTRDERNMGDLDDLPLEQHEEFQPSRLHKKSQPIEQLEEVI